MTLHPDTLRLLHSFTHNSSHPGVRPRALAGPESAPCGTWCSLLGPESLLFCGEHLHPALDHGGWITTLPEKGR